MRKTGRSILQLAAGILACASLPVFNSSAQSYPVKPIHVLVGFPAGGSSDAIARLLAQKLSENLGQPVLVENRPGAAGAIATERVAKSPPDGYTLSMLVNNDTVQPALRKLPYDVERDLALVSMTTTAPYLLVVHPSVPARNVKELIALARSQPGKLTFGTSGVGGGAHLAGELFKLMAKVNIVHVPYKGAAEAAVAGAAGNVDVSVPDLTGALPLLRAGKLRSLAATSARRASLLPSLPTLEESGLPGYDRYTWHGICAPAGVSKDIIARLNALIGKIANAPEMKEPINRVGLEPQTNTPEQFAAFVHKEIAENAKLIKLIGLKAE